MPPRWMNIGDGAEKRERRASAVPTMRSDGSRERPSDMDFLDAAFQSAPYKLAYPGAGEARKRHSIFGRRPSNAPSVTSPPALHPTWAATSIEDRPQPRARASTALGNERPTEHEAVAGWRNSIFARGKKSGRPAGPPKAASAPLYPDLPRPSTSQASPEWRERLRSEDDYYRHLKKLSISPPFNFQHVSHTARTQLPPLESTSQKDLVAEFWAVSAYQSPRQQLHGIDAEDLTAKHESMGITRGSPSSRPTSPTSPTLNLHQPRVASPLGDVLCADDADDTEPREAYFNDRSGTAHRSLRSADPVFHPRRSSSVGAMGFQYSSPAVSKQAARPAIAQDDTNNQTRAVGPSESSAALDAVPEESVDRVSSSPRTSGKRVRKSSTSSKQDLAKRPSQSSLKSSRECGTSRRTFMVPAGKADSIAATRSSCYTHRSAASSSNADLPGPGTGTDPTWEDDVDFCYELEAEASCDFDWDNGQHEREPSVESDGGVLLYPHTFTPPSTSKSPSKTPKQKASVGSLSAASPSGASSAKTRMSVGHRGFLEARHSRQASRESLTGPAIAPSTLKVTLTPGSLGGLSPIFSVIGAEDEIPKLSPALGAMHFSGFDSNGVESLSDPESTRSGGSKHRKSSSYGSYESISRPAPASRDTARWSVASISNVPDLLHSHRNDKLPLQGKRISTPLEVKSRKSGVQVPHIRSVSSTSALRPDRTPQEGAEKLIMRRPKTPEDRALLQAAGRAVQRGRPGTPNRFSRLLSPPPELPGDSARLSATNSSPDVSPCRLSQFPVPPSVPEGWI